MEELYQYCNKVRDISKVTGVKWAVNTDLSILFLVRFSLMLSQLTVGS